MLEEESAAFLHPPALSTPGMCSAFWASIEAQFLIRLDLKQLDHLFPVAQLRAAVSLFLCTAAAASQCHGWPHWCSWAGMVQQ